MPVADRDTERCERLVLVVGEGQLLATDKFDSDAEAVHPFSPVERHLALTGMPGATLLRNELPNFSVSSDQVVD